MDDAGLLWEYASSKSEAAFTALVVRHVPLVFSAALRQLQNQALAEDVTQVVFVILARKAGQLSQKTVLAGWLYRTTRNVAAKALRSEQRRRKREQEFLEMQTNEPEAAWEQLAPFLDEAMAQLGEVDRGAVLLRYFQNKSLREVGRAFGMSEDTAQKRVSRGIERLRRLLLKRTAFPETALSGLLSSHAAQIAPGHLSATVAATVLRKTQLSGSVFALLQESIKQAIWPKAATTASAIIAMAVAVGTFAWFFPKHRQQSTSYSFETKLALHTVSIAAMPPAVTKPLEASVKSATTPPLPEEIEPVIAPAVAPVPAIRPVPIKPVTNASLKVAFLPRSPSVPIRASNPMAETIGAAQIPTTRVGVGIRQPTGERFLTLPLTAPAPAASAAQRVTQMQPQVFSPRSPWKPANLAVTPPSAIKPKPTSGQ